MKILFTLTIIFGLIFTAPVQAIEMSAGAKDAELQSMISRVETELSILESEMAQLKNCATSRSFYETHTTCQNLLPPHAIAAPATACATALNWDGTNWVCM